MIAVKLDALDAAAAKTRLETTQIIGRNSAIFVRLTERIIDYAMLANA